MKRIGNNRGRRILALVATAILTFEIPGLYLFKIGKDRSLMALPPYDILLAETATDTQEFYK